MKKFLLGISMFVSGLLSIAIILAGTLASSYTVNGKSSFWLILKLYDLTPILFLLFFITVLGLILAIVGVFGHRK